MNPFKLVTDSFTSAEKWHVPAMPEIIQHRLVVLEGAYDNEQEAKRNSVEPSLVRQVTRSQVEYDEPQLAPEIITQAQPEAVNRSNQEAIARQAVDDVWAA